MCTQSSFKKQDMMNSCQADGLLDEFGKKKPTRGRNAPKALEKRRSGEA